MPMENDVDGSCVIRVRFKCKAEYQKFRKYILKTDWEYDQENPAFESLVVTFNKFEDLNAITNKIIELLQLGFDVCTCQYKINANTSFR